MSTPIIRIKRKHRVKTSEYLKGFYSYYPQENYTIFHFVKFLKARLRNNKDAWIGVSGDTGTGKSYFALMVGILFGRKFNLDDNITYIPTGDEIMKKFLKLNMNCFIIDEAALEMRSVNWQSKQQQKVNVAAMTERFRNNAVFLNMPNFNEFTKSMRTGNIIFRAVIPYRTESYARVIIQRKSRNWRSDDPWGDKRANDLYDKYEKRRRQINNNVILNIERSLSNSVMDFIIPNLELVLPTFATQYNDKKIESRSIKEEKEAELGLTKSNVYKDKYEKLLTMTTQALYNNELGHGEIRVTKNDVAGLLGISPATLNKYLAKQRDGSKDSVNFRKKEEGAKT